MTFPSNFGGSDSGRAGHRVVLFACLSVLAGVLVAGLMLPAVGLAGLTAKRGAENFLALPAELEVPPLKQRSTLLAADGTPIARFYSQNRVYVPLSKISQPMQDAIVAIEDARFYQHNGIDLQGTVRALVANTQAGGVTQGGSTITQQYVKNVLLDTAKTKAEREAAAEDSISRKIRELKYALGLEQQWSKQKILEGYLNIAYFGSQAYGVEVASRRYFSKPASKLNPGEAATIAGIVRYPSLYDPLEHPNISQDRRDYVLQRMADESMISQEQADKFAGRSMAHILDPSDLTRGCAVSKVPFFCDYVQRAFLDDPTYGKTIADRRALLNGGGLTIRTTLNLKDQASAQAAVEAHLPTGDPSGRAAAIAMVEPGTGNVRAMAQNLDYGTGPHSSFVNNAVDLKYSGTNGQQPGSTFKIFTVAASIEQGLPMNAVIYAPDSRVMPYGSYQDCEGATEAEWDVGNYTGAPSGNFNIYQGTAYSVNTYFAELAKRTGLCNIWDLASRAGVVTANTGQAPIDNESLQVTPGVIGGSFGMSPLTLANSYATFAARGLHCDTRVITSVTNRDHEEVASPKPKCNQVIEPAVADAVNDVMVGVIGGKVPNPTGAAMAIGRPAAGKTGTTDDYNAVWFAGYTPDLAAAVWAGDPEAPHENPMRYVTINGTYYSYVFGSSIPGPIWHDAMVGALADTPVSYFTPISSDMIYGDAISVPTVAGMTEQEAIATIKGAGLTPLVSSTTVNSSQAAGLVAYTSPYGGTGVSSGAVVTIFLSNGVPPSPTATPKPSNSDNSHPGSHSPSPSSSNGGGNGNPPGQGGGGGGGGGGGNH